MKYSIIRVISFQANFGSEVESMKDEIINKIIHNLKNTNEHFLKCILAYTNVLADRKDGAE